MILSGILVILFFLFFSRISRWTPAAGDDWVYASSARGQNPFLLTIKQYHTWSGRILSEFWGFTVAAHKGLWNVLNPLLFTGILVLLVILAGKREAREKNNGTTFLGMIILAAAMILSVPTRLRMQTYTWMMGTTYVVPLFLFLLDLVVLRQYLRSGVNNSFHRFLFCVMCLLNLMVPLYMENAAALMVGADLLLLLYGLIVKDKKLRSAVIIPFIFAVVGACTILMSPGAHARMAENAEFAALTIAEKIAVNWPNFLAHTFSNNAIIMRSMFLLAAIVVLQKRGKKKGNRFDPLSILIALPFLIAMVLNFGLLDFICVLYGLVLLVYYRRYEASFSDRCIFLILCALGADLVMLLSPIFDSRSSLYSVYLWILLILVLFQAVNESELLPRIVKAAAVVLLCALTAVEGYHYYRLYQIVGLVSEHRQGQIEYYAANPDVTDAWIMGFPEDSIHSADVVDGDTVHEKAFKAYYNLNPDVTLHFYYLKDYTGKNIAEN